MNNGELMELEFIGYEKRGRIAYITIDRPECLNAIHPPASREMREVFSDFKNDTEIWVAILSGSGTKAFSAGNDLKYHAKHGTQGEAYPDANLIPFGGITSNFSCWKPIIAAVNGFAMGGGFEIALACDLIVADESAQFGAPEVRVGLVAAAGGVHRIPRQLPLKIAMQMLLTGKRLTATEAYKLGLINEITPTGKALEHAETMAGEILKGAPLAIKASKQMATMGMETSLEEAMKTEYTEYKLALASKDFVEGPRAFTEKRAPKWIGK